VAERPVLPGEPGNAGGGKGPWFKTGAASGKAREIGASLVNAIDVRELRKVPQAEVKKEPGLRSGKPVTTQVVALAVLCSTRDRWTPG
jgi:hypothetical protein